MKDEIDAAKIIDSQKLESGDSGSRIPMPLGFPLTKAMRGMRCANQSLRTWTTACRCRRSQGVIFCSRMPTKNMSRQCWPISMIRMSRRSTPCFTREQVAPKLRQIFVSSLVAQRVPLSLKKPPPCRSANCCRRRAAINPALGRPVLDLPIPRSTRAVSHPC